MATEQAERERAADDLKALLNGYRATQAISAVATLGVADVLSETPRPIDEIAAAVGAHAAALYRLLRAVAALGVFVEHAGRRFSLAPMGRELRSDAPGTVGPWAKLLGDQAHRRPWDHLPHAVQSGENAFAAVFGTDTWSYRRAHPAHDATFNAAMIANARRIDGAVADVLARVLNPAPRDTIVDVAGGEGSLLAALLARFPEARGVLFDQPHVIARATATWAAPNLAERATLVGGDMFKGVPAQGAAYVLKFILHDWPDEPATAVLRACRDAMAPGGRVLIVEQLVAPPNEGAAAKLSDLAMLVGPGGGERTADEFAGLLAAAGLRLARVLPTAAHVSVLEAGALV